MKPLTYRRPRLRKNLWCQFRLGPKIRSSRPWAQSGIHGKIHSWSTNPLDLPQESTIRFTPPTPPSCFKQKKSNLFTHGTPRSSKNSFRRSRVFQDRIGIWKCWFLRRGENRSTRRKTSRSRVENQQQTQPTYDAGSGSRTRDTLVRGERSHHCANPAPPCWCPLHLRTPLTVELPSTGSQEPDRTTDGCLPVKLFFVDRTTPVTLENFHHRFYEDPGKASGGLLLPWRQLGRYLTFIFLALRTWPWLFS